MHPSGAPPNDARLTCILSTGPLGGRSRPYDWQRTMRGRQETKAGKSSRLARGWLGSAPLQLEADAARPLHVEGTR